MSDGWGLAIDFGTSRSAGAMAEGDHITPLEVEGNRWMPSMVLLDPDGTLLVGRAADNQAGLYPDRVERTPKRHMGTSAPLLLGDRNIEVIDAVASVMAVFLAEGRLRRNGTDPSLAVLTHPVRWGDERRNQLIAAAEKAGLSDVRLAEEPVAAAVHYATDQVQVGEYVGVYDLGGGTFDTAVLRRTEDGFETVGVPGGDEFIGGENFDYRLFEFFGRCIAEDDTDVWQLMRSSEERKWKRAALDLLVQARNAKEALSSYTQTTVFVPVADRDIVVTRAQFEEMIVEDIERTVDEMDDSVNDAGLKPDDLAAVYLVGGSSRIPLAVRLMTERFGDRVATRDEPKSVVALGAARMALRFLNPEAAAPEAPVAPGPAAPVPAPTAAPTTAWTGGAPQAPPPPSGLGSIITSAGPAAAPAPTAPTPAPISTAPAVPVDPLPPLEVDVSATTAPEVSWRIPLRGASSGAATDGRGVYFGTADGRLHGAEMATGNRLWSIDLSSAAGARPGVLAGRAYVGGGDGVVACVDVRNGGGYWRVPTLAPVTAQVLVVQGLAIAVNEGGSVCGIDAQSGALRWTLPLGKPVRTMPVPFSGGVMVACTDGRLYCVDLFSGRVRWAYQTGGFLTGTPTVADGLVFVPSGDGLLYALEVRSGKPAWGFRTGGPLTSPLALHGSSVVAVSADGAVYAIDRLSGRCTWRWSAGVAPTSKGPTIDRDTLYLDTGRGELWSVDLATRALRWRLTISDDGTVPRPTVAAGVVITVAPGPSLVAAKS